MSCFTNYNLKTAMKRSHASALRKTACTLNCSAGEGKVIWILKTNALDNEGKQLLTCAYAVGCRCGICIPLDGFCVFHMDEDSVFSLS